MKSLITTRVLLGTLFGITISIATAAAATATAAGRTSTADARPRDAQASVAALPPGSLDPAFKKSLSAFGNGGGFATHMAQLANSQALVVFSVIDGNERHFIVIRRYNQDGTHDRTFGGPGEVQATIRGGMPDLIPEAIVVTREGRILVAVTGFSGSQARPLIFSLTSAGTRDTAAFDGDGLFSPVSAIANPSNARILAADLAYDPATQRVTLGGTVEPHVGNGFLWTFTVDINSVAPFTETVVKEPGARLTFEAFTRLPGGEMVIAAGIVPASNGGIARGFLVRQLSNGLIVRKSIDVVGFETFISGVQVDAGRVFLAGTAFTNGLQTQGYVARFDLETLTKDTSFGSNGIRFVGDEVRAMAFSNDAGAAKDVLVAGTDGPDYLVGRMSNDGQMDVAFGTGGIALVSFSSVVAERAMTLSVDSANRIWTAGLTEPLNDSGFRAGLFRLLP